MKMREKFWCSWLMIYLYYNGTAYNGKDLEFVDDAGYLYTLTKDEANKLRKEKQPGA